MCTSASPRYTKNLQKAGLVRNMRNRGKGVVYWIGTIWSCTCVSESLLAYLTGEYINNFTDPEAEKELDITSICTTLWKNSRSILSWQLGKKGRYHTPGMAEGVT